MDMPLPIANAQMVDFVNLLMIINKSFNISEEEHRYKISFVNLASHEMRRDDPKLISHDAKIKRLKRGEAYGMYYRWNIRQVCRNLRNKEHFIKDSRYVIVVICILRSSRYFQLSLSLLAQKYIHDFNYCA